MTRDSMRRASRSPPETSASATTQQKKGPKMNTNRQDDRVFRYVHDILSTQRRGTGVPVVFGLTRVSNALSHFSNYLRYLLTDAPEPRTGELKRAVREIFEGTDNQTIGDGTVPKLDGGTLSSKQVAELAYLVMSLVEKLPQSSSRNWRKDIRSWAAMFIKYNASHGDLWEGFKKTSLATSGNPILIYRMFLLASGITHNTRFDPSRLGDNATLPQATANDYDRFKNAVERDPDFLDANIRAKIWRGFLDEINPCYLAAEFPKPDRRPLSAATMLEMFDCYFNCRAYTYDHQEYFIAAGKTLKAAKLIATRYWPMIGSIVMGPLICTNTMIGGGALILLLALWRNQRHSAANALDTVPHWGPRRTVAYTLLCAFVGSSPLLALITAFPVAVFAAHLDRKWEEIKAAA